MFINIVDLTDVEVLIVDVISNFVGGLLWVELGVGGGGSTIIGVVGLKSFGWIYDVGVVVCLIVDL